MEEKDICYMYLTRNTDLIASLVDISSGVVVDTQHWQQTVGGSIGLKLAMNTTFVK